MLGTAKKLRGAFFFFFHFWGHLGGKGDMEARDMRAQRKCGGWLRGVGGEPRSLTAAGRNFSFGGDNCKRKSEAGATCRSK